MVMTTATLAFAATNLDDIVMLMLLFSQPEQFPPRRIVGGQYLGFALLITLSLPGFLGGLVLPQPWLGLLGVVPVAMGISTLVSRNDSPEVQLTPSVNLPLLHPQTASVAALTVANGGDNIGVYVSLFAGQSWRELGITLLIFAVLMGVWCQAAHTLVRHPLVSHRLTQSGSYLIPPVLIGLGIFILWENETYQLLMGLPW